MSDNKQNDPALKTEQMTGREWSDRAVELDKEKDWSELLNHALCWTKAFLEHADAWFFLGNAYKGSDKHKAIEAYQKAIRYAPEEEPGKAFLLYALGFAYGLNNQPSEQIEAYQQAIHIKPDYLTAWYFLGEKYSEHGQPAKAIEAFQQAVLIEPDYVSAWYNLGFTYKKSGQIDKVMEVYNRLKTLDTEKADTFFKEVVSP